MSTDTLSPNLTLAPDLVSQLAGLSADGSVAALRAARADATRYTQGSHDALSSPDVADLTLTERLYAAWYAAWLTPSVAAAQSYRDRLLAASDDPSASAAVLDVLAARGLTAAAAAIDAAGGPRLAAILAHTHALITRPATTGKPELTALQSAGLTTRAIVALAQLVAFVSYQVRVVTALKALNALEQQA
jgi:CMD domain protein